jgi:hypothetical protein
MRSPADWDSSTVGFVPEGWRRSAIYVEKYRLGVVPNDRLNIEIKALGLS